MFGSLNQLLNAGKDENLPAYLKNKVKPTNIIALLLLFVVAIPFTVISVFYFPDLTLIPVAGIITCIGVIIANALGFIYFSRFILSLLPITLGALYNAYLCTGDDPPITCISLIELSFTLIPFQVFDFREKKFLFFSCLYCIIAITSFPLTKDLFESTADKAVLVSGWLNIPTIFLGVFVAIGNVYNMAFHNNKSEKASEKLVAEMEEKNKELEKSSRQFEENLKTLEESRIKEDLQRWINNTINTLSQEMRSNSGSHDIFDRILQHLTKSTKSTLGALYVVEEKNDNPLDKVIKLTASYAYLRKKFITKEYQIGEGLIGQCYLEGEYMYLKNLPENFWKITSGLGESHPRALIILPFKINDTIEGLLELASLQPYASHEIELLTKASEIIGSFIQSNRINEKTNKLLEETLKNSEMLKAQEEEMRQNMEELAATQEEMKRKEHEYMAQIQNLLKDKEDNLES